MRTPAPQPRWTVHPCPAVLYVHLAGEGRCLSLADSFPQEERKGATLVDYKILAVDDDAAALEAVVDLLRGEGYEVHAASSAEEAEELLHRESYHLVVTDLVMPGGKSGIELTAVVKENLPQALVLMVTGQPSL